MDRTCLWQDIKGSTALLVLFPCHWIGKLNKSSAWGGIFVFSPYSLLYLCNRRTVTELASVSYTSRFADCVYSNSAKAFSCPQQSHIWFRLANPQQCYRKKKMLVKVLCYDDLINNYKLFLPVFWMGQVGHHLCYENKGIISHNAITEAEVSQGFSSRPLKLNWSSRMRDHSLCGKRRKVKGPGLTHTVCCSK